MSDRSCVWQGQFRRHAFCLCYYIDPEYLVQDWRKALSGDGFATRALWFAVLRIQVFGTFLRRRKGRGRGKGGIWWPLHAVTLILLVQQQKYIFSHCSSKTWVEMCTTDFKHTNSHSWPTWWFSLPQVPGDVTSKRLWNLPVISYG